MTAVLDNPKTPVDRTECNPEILERLILANLIALNEYPDEDTSDSGWALTDLLRLEVDDAVDLIIDGYDARLMSNILDSCINFIVDTAAALTSKTSIEAHEDTVERFNALKASIRKQLVEVKTSQPQTREDRAVDRRLSAVCEARRRGDYEGEGGNDRYQQDLQRAGARPMDVH